MKTSASTISIIRIFLILLLISLLVFVLAFPETAVSCARSGLILWYGSLLPVLFPFMILSGLLIRLDGIRILLFLFHPPIHLIWGTSIYGSYALLAGFLFGCPMGAKITGDLLREQKISREEASYLVCFVNNLSPSFLITYLVHQNLQAPSLLLPTLIILYGAPLLTGLILMPRFRTHIPSSDTKKEASKAPFSLELIDACIFDGILNITKLGGYILLFSLITGAWKQLFPGQLPVFTILGACLEITAGIPAVCALSLPFSVRYLVLVLLCSFGGICTLMQTLSVFPMNCRLLRRYLLVKMLTMLISGLLSLSLIRPF